MSHCVKHEQCPECAKLGKDRSETILLYTLMVVVIVSVVVIINQQQAYRRLKKVKSELQELSDFHEMWMKSYHKSLGISSDSIN